MPADPRDEGFSGRTMPWARLALAALVLATFAKAYLLTRGPDLEPDAYGHALAARRMLQDPGDLAAHWVWLPLGHLVSACFLHLGAGMQGMRWANLALTSLLPLGVAAAFARERRPLSPPVPLEAALPWTAAAIVALSPIALATGETGALEPGFVALVLGSCLAARSPRDSVGGGVAGVLASCAALLRYEGWMLPPVLFVAWWRRGRGRTRAVAWAAPAATILAYVVARACVERTVLSFVSENDSFARSFYLDAAARWAVQPHPAWMALWYAAIVPAIDLGPLVPFAFTGAPWLWRRGPQPLVAALAAVLLFLTVGFVLQKHMGLLRHALTLTPLYAAAAASGLLSAAAAFHRRFGGRPADAERWAFGFVAAGLVVLAASRTMPTVAARAKSHETAHRDDLAMAQALRSVHRPGAIVHCDVTPVETLSDLPPSAFVRWQLPETPRYNLEAERSAGHDVLVVTTSARTAHLAHALVPLARSGDLVLSRYAPDGAPAEASHFLAGAHP